MADDKAKYEISLIDKYSKTINKIDRETQAFDNRVVKLGKTMTSVFLGAAVLGGAVRLVGMTQKLAGGMEQTEIAFNTFLGSAEKGKSVLDNLNEFANRTPFTNQQIIKTGRSLLAANVPAEELTNTLAMIGDVASGANIPITDLGAIYAKVMNKGKIQAEELNQMAERGIPIIDQLSKEFGVTKQQVFELGSKGKITSATMIKAFSSMTKEGGKFFKLMEKQSKSAVGLLSTLQGKTEMLGVNIGKRLLPAQKKLTKQTISLVDKLNAWVKIPVADAIKDEQKEVNKLTLRLKDVNTKEQERREILEQLEKISPNIVKGLSAENINMKTLNKNIERYNENAAKRIVLANLTDNEQKQAVRQAAALTKKLDAEDRIRQSLTRERVDELEKGGDLIELAKKELVWREKVIKANRSQASGIGAIANAANKEGLGKRRTEVIRLSDAISDLTSAQFDLAETQNKSLDLSKRAQRLRGLLGLGTGGGGASSVVTGKIEGAEDVTAGITKITSAAPKVFNININNLVENFEISTTNLPEAQVEIKNQVIQTLLEGLADVQPLVR